MNGFGDFLYELRKSKGLTQKSLAEALGVTDKAVSKWETGTAFPATELLAPLADSLGVTVDELLRGREHEAQAAGEEENAAEGKFLPIAVIVAAVCTALSSLFFIIFVGCRGYLENRVQMYDYFYTVYANLIQSSFYFDSVPFFAYLFHTICGTVIAAGTFIAEAVLAVTVIVRSVKLLCKKQSKSAAQPTIACYYVYVLACILMLAQENMRVSVNGDVLGYTCLNATSITGLVLGALCLTCFLVFSFLRSGLRFNRDRIIKFAFSFGGIALTVVLLVILASPLAGVQTEDTVCNFSVPSLIKLYADEFINIIGSLYEGLIFTAICYLFILPLCVLSAVRLTTLTNNLIDGKNRSTTDADVAACVLAVLFTVFIGLPVREMAGIREGAPLFSGVIAICVLSCFLLVCSIAHMAVKSIIQKKTN